ncbi:two-component regulator propeller domain-containing protein [Limibacter armeniacum]|uniref:two-component regulator propeller domain-containing protein n=1 Tax=Limibacter armeniacum TaxID=466084 RepID=UPI002FE66C61
MTRPFTNLLQNTLFVILLTCVSPMAAMSSYTPISFRSIGAEDGLSQSDIYCILQDSKGFIWLGTDDGLNKYDGYTFTAYHRSLKSYNSISFNSIRALFEDSQQNLWVGTHAGLNRYCRTEDNFEQFGPNEGLLNHDIRAITEDRSQNLWIGTAGNGVFLYNLQNNTFTQLPYDGLKQAHVTALVSDYSNNIWIGTTKGLYKYHQQHGLSSVELPVSNPEVRCLTMDSFHNLWIGSYGEGVFCHSPTGDTQQFIKTPNGLTGNEILSIAEGPEKKLWVGTEGGGICIFDLNKRLFNPYNFQTEQDLSTQAITSIYQDKEGNVWLGVYNSGLKLYNNRNPFLHYRHLPYQKNSLSNNKTTTLFEDRDGIWWIGTDGGGLNRFDPKTGQFTVLKHQPQNPYSLSSDHILSIAQDEKGNLWIGTYRGGLNLLEIKTMRVTRFLSQEDNPNSLTQNNVWTILIDKTAKVWCGTSNGISIYNPATKQFTNYTHENTTLSNNEIRMIFEDIKQDIWIGTFNGLNRYKPDSGSFEHFPLPKDEAVPAKGILSIFEDSRLDIWIGTFGAGLYRFDRTTQKITAFEKQHSLSNQVILSIEEDQQHNLWLSTNTGLTKFDLNSSVLTHYTAENGVQNGKFQRACSMQLSNGDLAFGGISGFNIFDPTKVATANLKLPVRFTDFSLFNQPVKVGQEGSPLQAPITETSAITLSPSQKVFSVSFSAMSFVNTSKVEYAYLLDGFDKEWNYIGHNRTATYTNLPPGTYTLKVKASLDPTEWKQAKESQLTITVLPYLWETIYFKILTVLLGISIILLVYRRRLSVIRRREEMLNRLVEQRTDDLRKQQKEAMAQQVRLLEAEHENAELMQQQLKEQLLFKQKELTSHTLHTIHKNELLKKLSDTIKASLKKPEGNSHKELQRLIREIDASFELDRDWGKFHDLFSEVHRNFIRALQQQYPNLTNANQKLCYLYRMQLSSQEIAHTLGISINSVKVARHRLRKKLGLNEDESLRGFLAKLGEE